MRTVWVPEDIGISRRTLSLLEAMALSRSTTAFEFAGLWKDRRISDGEILMHPQVGRKTLAELHKLFAAWHGFRQPEKVPVAAPIVSLMERRLQPVQQVVDQLEAWLERAKAGKLVALALAGVDDEGSALDVYTTLRTVSLIGAVSMLQFRMCQVAKAGCDEGPEGSA